MARPGHSGATSGDHNRASDDGFSAAFGSIRGPDRNTLFRELAAAQEQLVRRNERIAELESKLEREARLRAIAQGATGRLESRIQKAERQAHVSAYRMQMVTYAALYRVPADHLPDWAVRWVALDAGALQGEFSPRRPYLLHQIVRDGSHGLFSATDPLSPSRVRPHRDPQRWEPIDEHTPTQVPRRADVPADQWRFGVTRSGRLDGHSDDDLRVLVAEARVDAKREWAMELREAALLYPCPASAYLSARQWLEDMPGFRAVVNELRRRTRVARHR